MAMTVFDIRAGSFARFFKWVFRRTGRYRLSNDESIPKPEARIGWPL